MNVIKYLSSIVLACLLAAEVYGVGSGALGNQAGISTKATAHGFSFAGVADDPSAVFYNPAGLVQVKGIQAILGATVLDIKTEHATLAGIKDTTASNLPLVPNFYLSWSDIDSPWAFGLGVYSPFGLITEWKDDSFAQYYATESKLLMYAVNPTVAFAVNDHLFFGAGLDFFNVYDVELNQKVIDISGGGTEGDGKLSADGTGWGYNLGVLWKPHEKHSLGLAYRSQVNVVVEGETTVTNIPAVTAGALFGGASSFKTGTSSEFKFPQSVLLGYGFRPSGRWTIFADYEWVNWTTVEETKFNYEQNALGLTQSVPRNWKSTNNLGVGAEWAMSEVVDLRFGGLVYEQVVPSSTLEAAVPDSSRWALTFGTGIHLGNTTLDFGYNAIFFNDRSINNDQEDTVFASYSQDGEYKTFINVFSFGVSQKWGGKS
ncbi:hypothetical protein BVX98_05140 [bacterium F11]|nr:hypothetical protein BVX98_05140 [bacterium F11]